MEARETCWVALSSTSLHLFLQGADGGSFSEARKAACGSHHLIWLTEHISSWCWRGLCCPWRRGCELVRPLSAQAGASAEPRSPNGEQVLLREGRQHGVLGRAPWGQEAAPNFDLPTHQLTGWPFAIASPHFTGPSLPHLLFQKVQLDGF